ncbi:MAG: YARHG domain-containing protein [Verrucomicrobiota bacterium]|nr:YARHG domain-containing protein [Verrucomicrobiota bacterium]
MLGGSVALTLVGGFAVLEAPAQEKGDRVENPYYFDRKISEADLKDKTLRELSLVRNSIFARAGNEFRKQWLNDYFAQFAWYEPTGLDMSKVSKRDLENAALVAEFEVGISRKELQATEANLLNLLKQKKIAKTEWLELGLISRALGRSVPAGYHSYWQKQQGQDVGKTWVDPFDPKSFDRILKVVHLTDYSRRDLRLLRNTIYARHGRAFKSDSLRQYFARQDWYKVDKNFQDSQLTEVDQKNLKLIMSVEQSIGGPLSEADHLNWFGRA